MADLESAFLAAVWSRLTTDPTLATLLGASASTPEKGLWVGLAPSDANEPPRPYLTLPYHELRAFDVAEASGAEVVFQVSAWHDTGAQARIVRGRVEELLQDWSAVLDLGDGVTAPLFYCRRIAAQTLSDGDAWQAAVRFRALVGQV